MRLIEFNNLVEGMKLGQEIYGLNGEILAKTNTTITAKLKTRLSALGIPYLYIDDCCSEDISIHQTISPHLKSVATQNIKKLYQAIQSNQPTKFPKLMQACLTSVDKITEEIITQKLELHTVFDIKIPENYPYQHPVNVMIISVILGKELNLNALDIYKLGLGAFLFDVGEMFIPKEVYNKLGKYSDQEYKLMQKHTHLGYEFAKEEFYLPMKSYLAILQHHERYDGTGYPNQKSGKTISEFGRIVAIADVYDALSSKRTYREALKPAAAFKIVVQDINKAFDPDFIRIFANRVSPYPIGLTLSLPDGRKGIVSENYLGSPFNPSLKIIEENGEILKEPYLTKL